MKNIIEKSMSSFLFEVSYLAANQRVANDGVNDQLLKDLLVYKCP